MLIPNPKSNTFLRDDIKAMLSAIVLTTEAAALAGASQEYTTGFTAAIAVVAVAFGIEPWQLEVRR